MKNLFLVSILLLFSYSAFSQNSKNIYGRISSTWNYNDNYEAIDSAIINVYLDQELILKTTSDKSGHFELNLPINKSYHLKVIKKKFKPKELDIVINNIYAPLNIILNNEFSKHFTFVLFDDYENRNVFFPSIDCYFKDSITGLRIKYEYNISDTAINIELDTTRTYMIESRTISVYAIRKDDFNVKNNNIINPDIMKKDYIKLYVSSDKALASQNTPIFPIPVPTPSAFYPFENSSLKNISTLAQVNLKLKAALEKQGYTENKYLSLPNGFALLTHIEQINDDGTSKTKQEGRFDISSIFNISNVIDYFSATFFNKFCRSRMIVFLVTDVDINTQNNTNNQKQLDDWYNKGYISLPDQIGSIKYSPKHKLTVLIYEYEKKFDSEYGRILIPSKLTAKDHLIKSKLWNDIIK